MAKCPKCGYKLKLWDLSQFCPKCKTNMRFCNFEEEFYTSAKLAELDQAAFHIKMRRLKASFTGSKLIIARLALCFIPVVMFLIPAGAFRFEMPYKTVDFSVGLLGLVNLFMGGDFGFITGMKSSGVIGAEFTAIFNTFISYLVPAFFAICVLVSTLLAFISIKNMQKVICTFAAGGMLSAVVAQIMMYVQLGSIKNSSFVTGNAGFGLYAVIIAFAVIFTLNFIINKKGVPVVYDEGMEERLEILKKVKAGEVKIEDLPQPVVETEETRKIEDQIREEEEKMAKGGAEK